MKNKSNILGNYVKKYPVTALSAACVLFEFLCFVVFIERINTAAQIVFYVTVFIAVVLHEDMLENKKNDKWS